MKNLCIALLLVTTSLTFAQKAKPKTTPKATTGALATFENLKAEIITEGGKQKLAIVMDNAGKKENVILKDFITKDKVAEILGTNRTYLSRIINEQSKLSFTHYVNRFRIEEAIRLLSDPTNETPLKAISTELGFNSISTFYNLFQSSVGMTPSQYRNKVMELQKEQ